MCHPLTSRRPLTFVTSVYGMTNMPEHPSPYWSFAITLAAVCIPFFSLIGFLSTDFGYRIWVRKTKQFYHWLKPKAAAPPPDVDDSFEPRPVDRTLSTEEGMRLRMGMDAGKGERERRATVGSERGRESLSHPHIRKMVEAMGEGRQSGLVRMGTVTGGAEAKAGSGDTVVDVKDG